MGSLRRSLPLHADGVPGIVGCSDFGGARFGVEELDKWDEVGEGGVDNLAQAVARYGVEHVFDIEGDERAGGEGAVLFWGGDVLLDCEANGGLDKGDAAFDAEGIVVG